MKPTKFFVIYLSLLTTLVSISCSKNEDADDYSFAQIENIPTEMISAKGETIQMFVTSNTTWNVSTTQNWLSFNPSRGSNNSTISIDISPNNTGKQRTGYFYLYYRDKGNHESSIQYVIKQSSSENEDNQNSGLSAPNNFTATRNGTSIYLTWDKVMNANKYSIYRSSNQYSEFKCLNTTTTTYFTDSSPLTGMNYYKITASNENSTSGYSATISINLTSSSNQTTKPNAPTGLSVQNIGNSYTPEIKISWNSVSNATSYKIYRSNSSSGSYTQIGNATSSTFGNDTNPLSGKNYYKVKAINNAGESEFSSYIMYNNDTSSSNIPAVPTVSVSGSSSITVSWSCETGGNYGKPTKYEVYKRDPKTSEFNQITTTSSTSYRDSSPHPGINWYGVIAINEAGKSNVGLGKSNEIPLAKPSTFSATKSGNAYVKFTWSKVNNATGYQIFSSSSAYGTYFIAQQIEGETTTTYTYYYPASSGTTVYFKIRAYWYVFGSMIVSDFTTYKSVKF